LAGRIVERHAFARAGLLGNPSDGYFGRTLSVTLRNFRATVTLEESTHLRIEPDAHDSNVFPSVQALVESVTHEGYYGGARLVKAAIKTFSDHCHRHDVELPTQNFSARYQSSIPRQVGLAGSSAIVTATLRTLMDFFELDIPKEEQANLILSAETKELGITAGLQDRVAQVYEGLVYMDFSREHMENLGYGVYESLDPALLPTMFVAYQTQPTKVSGLVLNDLKSRWEQGDTEVHETLGRIAALASSGRDILLEGDHQRFSSLMNENFDLRRRIMRIDERDLAMIGAARALGASAKLTGSGGAIIGVYESNAVKEYLDQRLDALGALVIEAETTERKLSP
jgi:glucuronokinase